MFKTETYELVWNENKNKEILPKIQNFSLTNKKPNHDRTQKLVLPMSDAGADPQHQPPPGPGVAVELSDKRRKL